MTSSPLTPPECDLRDFAFMPVEVDRLLKSETWVLGTGDERSAAITLWLQSWHQVPAGSLPEKDQMLAHLSQAGAKWKKVKDHALRGWIHCSDGRLYHPVVCEKVLEAWLEKLGNSLSGATGNAKRWNLEIDVTAIRRQFVHAVDLLRAIAPQSKSLKKKMVISIVVGSPPDSPPDDKGASPPDSGKDRKGQRQRQGHINTNTEGAQISTTVGEPEGPFAPTLAGQVGLAMKRGGADPTHVNLADPRLAELLRQGATPDEFEGLAREAVAKGIDNPWPWVLKVLPERRKDAQAIALAPKAGPTESAYDKRMREQAEEVCGVFASQIVKRPPDQPRSTAKPVEVIDAEPAQQPRLTQS